jgi:trk system potassium uptake protein TrkH
MSASVAASTNTVHGLGRVGPMRSYHGLSAAQTWLCASAMLMGRLEIFSVFVLFTPAFLRK